MYVKMLVALGYRRTRYTDGEFCKGCGTIVLSLKRENI
jgi:hypothetical protein